MASARLCIQGEMLTQSVHEFAEQLKVCAKAWGDKNNINTGWSR